MSKSDELQEAERRLRDLLTPAIGDRYVSVDEARKAGVPRNLAASVSHRSIRLQAPGDVDDLVAEYAPTFAESLAAEVILEPSELAQHVPTDRYQA